MYDRVNKWGGAERVLLALHEMFPDAPFYTSVYDEKGAAWALSFPKIYTSFLQKIPFAKRAHEFLGTFMPLAFETFNFDKYDLVISVTSEAAKGIITKPGTLHICYMLTPTRYLWSHYDLYFKSPILRFISKPVVNYLRVWDKIAASRPDKIIAISTEVARRIKKYYGRDSEIVFPPVDDFSSHRKKLLLRGPLLGAASRNFFDDAYLYVGRLVQYKKVDLLVDVFNKLGKKLVIVGSGSEEKRLKTKSKKNIKFVGEVSDGELIGYYCGAKALIMPQEEDFGITSVEAQSFGVPVIAYNKGGAQDTVIDGKTGVLFSGQNFRSLADAIAKFEKMSFNDKLLAENAARFIQKPPFRSYFGRWWRHSSLAKIPRKNS